MKALRIPDGTVEALKWLALVLMTGDHVNKYLFNATLPVLFEAGRVALPLFVFVLAYNLARPGTLERGVYGRTMSRLAMFGALASVPFVALGGLYAGWWPLNVMFTLLVVTATAYLVERGGKLHLAAAGVVFLVGGSSVEYWWPAVAFGLAVWSYTRRPSWAAAAVAVLACAALWFVNRNLWALAALPVLFLASRVDVRVPRLRWAFYAYYPLHLASLWLIDPHPHEQGRLPVLLIGVLPHAKTRSSGPLSGVPGQRAKRTGRRRRRQLRHADQVRRIGVLPRQQRDIPADARGPGAAGRR